MNDATPRNLDEALAAQLVRRNFLQHSFYLRWNAGTLTPEELQDYACQYAHVVRALPRWLENAAAADTRWAADLQGHAAEESGHVALWDEFAAALGVSAADYAAGPNSATRELIAAGDELARQGLGAAAAWAVEAQSPEVSASKLAGLREHRPELQAGERYFILHQSRDVEHAEELRQMMVAAPESLEAQVAAAGRILDGLWVLLDSVERVAA